MLLLLQEGLKHNEAICYTIYQMLLVRLLGLFYVLESPKLDLRIRQEVTLVWFVHVADVLNRNQISSQWEHKTLKMSFLEVYISNWEMPFQKQIQVHLAAETCCTQKTYILKENKNT